ncbi:MULTISPECIES: hypothetical protein [unclassified Microbacterium]|uniref:hypothetical protein n=1 Tax=unclassified Microbacterium TaxID=2609290 RepID=UPI00301A631F
MQTFKAKVRRREFEEDDSWIPEDERWPAEMQWVAEWSRYDEDGKFISGCASPHETHGAALVEAIAEADEVRRLNALESGDLLFRCLACGWSTLNREVEQHICPGSGERESDHA